MTGKVRPQTGRAALRWAVSFLIERGWPQDKAQLESRVLLGQAKGLAGIKLIIALDETLLPEIWVLYQELIIRLSKHEPLQYLTERQDFMGLTFRVTPAVLIPRWDTEVLVEEALRRLSSADAPRILDLGTGSGAIAISLAYYKPASRVWAVDISAEALPIAKENAVNLGVEERITFLQGDLFSPLQPENSFELIVSNPPYITEREYQELSAEVKKEPYQALVGGQEGLEYYQRIAKDAARYLTPAGWLMVEIGWQQGEVVQQIFARNGFKEIKVLNDTAGHPRVVRGQI